MLVAGWALLLASPALAAPVAPIAPDPAGFGDIALVDGGLAWSDANVVRVVGADGAARVVHRGPRPTRRREVFIGGFSSAAGSLAFERMVQDLDAGGISSEWLRGPESGPFAPVGDVTGAVLTSAGLVVARRAPQEDSFVVELRPDDGSPARTLTTARPTRHVELAAGGPFVAVQSMRDDLAPGRGTITVYDARSGAQVLRVNIGGLTIVGVGADGTLAWGDLTDDSLMAASPASPSPRRIARNPDAVAGVAGGRVAYIARKPPTPLRRVRLVDLATGRAFDASPLLGSPTLQASFDGERLAYLDGSCVYSGDAPAAAVRRTPRGGACRLPPVVVGTDVLGGGRVSIAVTCPGGPEDRCAGTVVLRGDTSSSSSEVVRFTYRLAGGRVMVRRLSLSRAEIRLGTPVRGARRFTVRVSSREGRKAYFVAGDTLDFAVRPGAARPRDP